MNVRGFSKYISEWAKRMVHGGCKGGGLFSLLGGLFLNVRAFSLFMGAFSTCERSFFSLQGHFTPHGGGGALLGLPPLQKGPTSPANWHITQCNLGKKNNLKVKQTMIECKVEQNI